MDSVLKAAIYFSDRNLNEAAVTITFLSDIEPIPALNAAIEYANVILGISNAIVTRVKIRYTDTISDGFVPGLAEATSTPQQKAIVFLGNDSLDITTLTVPMAKQDIWRTTGDYDGVLIDNDIVTTLALDTLLSEIIQQTCNSQGVLNTHTYITIARAE